ncbi:MAG: hypothetical protein J3Q66DRAFT_16598 [Benniella sp.]|nr:MAG: hypothetical protein J3Q66DRAFT_16598 [Benniella sp.]
MTSVPSFENACIAPAATGPSDVWLVGVTGSAGRLDAYIVNLANLNAPSARFIATQVEIGVWSGLAERGCYPFINTKNDPNTPILMHQFGTLSYGTHVFPNGTIASSAYFTNATFISPKTFSLSPAVDGINWFAALTNNRLHDTHSGWVGIRIRSDWSMAARGNRDRVLSVYPTETPLLSVGTFELNASGSNSAYHTVFDTDGSGTIYAAVGNSGPIQTSSDRVLTLANPQKVDMNGITLSEKAIPVTMNSVGYILDQALDGTTMVYSISPNRDVKLRRVGALSDVLPFKSSMAASYMDTQIVVYSSQGKPVFNTFDTVTRKWSGPGLIKSQLQVSDDLDDTSSKVPLAAIIGGVVGGLVVIAVAVFLIIRYRRRKTRSPGNSAEKVDSGNTNADSAPVQQSPSSPPPPPTQQVVISEEQKIQQPQPSHLPQPQQPQPPYLPQPQQPQPPYLPQPQQPQYFPQPQQPQPLYLPQPQQQFMHQPQPIQQYGQFGPQQPYPHTIVYPDGQRQSYIYVPPTFVPVQQPYPDPNSPPYSQRAHSPPVPSTSGTDANTSDAGSPTSPQHPNSFHP